MSLCFFAAKGQSEGDSKRIRSKYLRSNEKQRDKILRDCFSKSDLESNLRDLIFNLLDCFDWCRNSRHQIIHSEKYPASFSVDEVVQLTKREKKSSDTSIYMAFDTKELRAVADKMQECVVRSAKLSIILRYYRQSKVPPQYLPYILDRNMPLLVVPPALISAQHPL
jgi:hypothetical protein